MGVEPEVLKKGFAVLRGSLGVGVGVGYAAPTP